jgi:hypothetical protein
MDITQALKDTENALRDFIGAVLRKKLGDDWADKCGVSPERLEEWKERRSFEEKRQEAGGVAESLIYYADFYDLKTILKKHWFGEFSTALGDWKRMEVWLSELERLRDPEANRRELLPHQRHLALGITGEIRTRLVRHRSKEETGEEYFPRIESVRDNYGNIWTPEVTDERVLGTGTVLRPNDLLEFVITAIDPLNDKLEYRLAANQTRDVAVWVKTNFLAMIVQETDIGELFLAHLAIRSPRSFHAYREHDDEITFAYRVLPPMT